ncbi:MAG: AsmA-like C-terminal region-containing protein [Pseudomonadota bacterium]
MDRPDGQNGGQRYGSALPEGRQADHHPQAGPPPVTREPAPLPVPLPPAGVPATLPRAPRNLATLSLNGLKRARRPFSWLLRCTALVLVLGVLVAGMGYFRLQQGPISVGFLVAPLERAMNKELSDLTVRIEDAVVQASTRGAFEFRLRNVRLFDNQGDIVAIAPLASIELSGLALMRARLAPSRINLIAPRMVLVTRPDGSVSLSFSGTADAAPAQATPSATKPTPSAADRGRIARFSESRVAKPETAETRPRTSLPLLLRRIDLAKTIADAAARARQRVDASSFLRSVGLRNAVVIFERGRERQVWRAPDIDVRLTHKAAERTSQVTAVAQFQTKAGPWQVKLRTIDSGETKRVALMGEVENLPPGELAAALPQFAILKALRLPVNARSRVQLANDGKVVSGDFMLKLGAGTINLPFLAARPLRIDSGQLNLRYVSATQSLEIKPSILRWGGSHVRLAGRVVPAPAQDGEEVWRFEVRALDGVMAADAFNTAPLRLERLRWTGWITPARGRVQIEQLYVKAGPAEIAVAADIVDLDTVPRARVEGRIGRMSVDAFKALWPAAVQPDARVWAGHNITAGQVDGGHFKIEADGQVGANGQPAYPRVSLTLKASDLKMRTLPSLPAARVPRALVQLTNDHFEITMPRALIKAEGQAADADGVALRAITYRIPLVWDPNAKPAATAVKFTMDTPLKAFLDTMSAMPGTPFAGRTLPFDAIKGRVRGAFTVTFPVELASTAPVLTGSARVTKAAFNVRGAPLKISAGSIDVAVSAKALTGRGTMLINGVPAKAGVQRLFNVPLGQQPPLRVTMKLDNADRDALGIDINHLVDGVVPVELIVKPRAQPQPPLIQVRANLTTAALAIRPLAWLKPAGQRAVMAFDVAGGSVYPIELQNFKLDGERIGIDGWIAIDDKQVVREFVFPEFTLDVVSRLEVQGTFGKDGVWDVKAKGATFDGRTFFRSLFALDSSVFDRFASTQKKPSEGVLLRATIDNLLGFEQTSLRNVDVRVTRRKSRVTSITASGEFENRRRLEVNLRTARKGNRIIFANTADAGRAFKLIGFYNNAVGGQANLRVNLDGTGAVEKTGLLKVRKFFILGDPVVAEVLQNADERRPAIARARRRRGEVVRERFDVTQMRVPFLLGSGQFVLRDSYLRGPVIGASVRGKVDFQAKRIDLGGTYTPLSEINSALCNVPLFGPILTGPRCDGIFGVTFAVQGPLNQPQVIVNPLSLVTPGIFRGLMEMSPQNPRVRARRKPGAAGKSRRKRKTPQVRSSQERKPRPRRWAPRQVYQDNEVRRTPQLSDGWSVQTVPKPKR